MDHQLPAFFDELEKISMLVNPMAALMPGVARGVIPGALAGSVGGAAAAEPGQRLRGGLAGGALGAATGGFYGGATGSILPRNIPAQLLSAGLMGGGTGTMLSKRYSRTKKRLEEGRAEGAKKRKHKKEIEDYLSKQKEGEVKALKPGTTIDVTPWTTKVRLALGNIGRAAQRAVPYAAHGARVVRMPTGMAAAGALPAALLAPEDQRLEAGLIGGGAGIASGAAGGLVGALLGRAVGGVPGVGKGILAGAGTGAGLGGLLFGSSFKKDQENWEREEARRKKRFARSEEKREKEREAMGITKENRATLTWGMEKDPRALPRMAPGMYAFGGTPRIMANDRPGFYKPPTPGFRST